MVPERNRKTSERAKFMRKNSEKFDLGVSDGMVFVVFIF